MARRIVKAAKCNEQTRSLRLDLLNSQDLRNIDADILDLIWSSPREWNHLTIDYAENEAFSNLLNRILEMQRFRSVLFKTPLEMGRHPIPRSMITNLLCPLLRNLTLGNVHLNLDQMYTLGLGLRHTRELTSLSFLYTAFEEGSFLVLSDSLEKNRSLQHLKLCHSSVPAKDQSAHYPLRSAATQVSSALNGLSSTFIVGAKKTLVLFGLVLTVCSLHDKAVYPL